MKGRLVLLGVSLPLLMFWAVADGSHSAVISASAVGRLRQLHKDMAEYRSHHQSYPETMPNASLRQGIDRYYGFELVPSHSSDRKVVDYLIQATPYHRPCAAMPSFAIASDGRIFYTREPRAATAKDQVLE